MLRLRARQSGGLKRVMRGAHLLVFCSMLARATTSITTRLLLLLPILLSPALSPTMTLTLAALLFQLLEPRAADLVLVRS